MIKKKGGAALSSKWISRRRVRLAIQTRWWLLIMATGAVNQCQKAMLERPKGVAPGVAKNTFASLT